jgi:hypothetical protein
MAAGLDRRERTEPMLRRLQIQDRTCRYRAVTPHRTCTRLLAIAVLALVVAACVPQTGGSPPRRTGDQNGSLGSCSVFPAGNPWNADVSAAPVHAQSSTYLSQIAADGGGGAFNFLHADFGGNGA